MQDANRKAKLSALRADLILDQSVFENVWLPVGDDKDADVAHLIAQGRIRKD